MRRRLNRLLHSERGYALVVALGFMTILGITFVTVIDYTTANSRTANYSRSRLSAFGLAEAGMNNAMAILNKPTNNALDPDMLPGTTKTYENGSVTWSGSLDRSNAIWTVTSKGETRNPTGPKASKVTKVLTAKVTVVPTYTQPLNNPAWNYIYATKTGDPDGCDEYLSNNLSGNSRFFVAGNLCLNNNVGITSSSLIVNGNLDVANNAFVGASTSMATRVETYVGGNCRYGSSNPPWVTCTGNQDANHIWSKLSDGSTVGVNHTPPVVAAPSADFANWYENAIPGPSQSCTTSSGTPPTFDTNYPSRDNSVGSVFDLTPSSASYTCRVGPGAQTTLSGAMTASQTTLSVASASNFPTAAFDIRVDDEIMRVTGGFGTTSWTVTRGTQSTTAAAHSTSQTVEWDNAPTSGELNWNASSKTLSVKGTIYIDGSAKIGNGALSTYNGQATIYLSGTLLINGSLCGGVSGSACDFNAWNPNTEMLTFVVNGSGGQVNAGNSIQLNNNWTFQGGLFATNNIEYSQNSKSDGPIMGHEIILANNVNNDSFPTITTVPVGMPGNPAVYAQPNPPQSFSG